MLVALLLCSAVPVVAADHPAVPAHARLTLLSHGPVGLQEGQVQLQAVFSSPLVPLSGLDDPRRSWVLSRFSIEPPMAGKFRMLGTSAVVFDPERAIPPASRYKVTIAPDLNDMAGNTLGIPVTWEFTTPPINLQLFPTGDHVKLRDDAVVTSNIALDLDSLREHAALSLASSKWPLPFLLVEDPENPKASEDLGFERRGYRYLLRPTTDYPKDTAIALTVTAGVRPLIGNLPTQAAVTTTFKTYGPFRFTGFSRCDGCGNKLVEQPAIDFTNRPDWEGFRKAVTVAPKSEEFPFASWGCRWPSYGFAFADIYLEPKTGYAVALPKGLKDIYGQELENPGNYPFTTSDLTPRLWAPEGYRVASPHLPASIGVKTVRVNEVTAAIAPLAPEDFLKPAVARIAFGSPDEDWYSSRDSIDARGIFTALGVSAKPMPVPLASNGIGRTTVAIAPMLSGGKYGAVAFSFSARPTVCGQDEMAREGLILRTDLGVFTQFLPTGGLIKVNRLSDGTPVAGAQITLWRHDAVVPSSDPAAAKLPAGPPAPCWTGTTDERGIVELDAEASRVCMERKVRTKIVNEVPPEMDSDDELYDAEEYGSSGPPKVIVLARKDDDWTVFATSRYGNPSVWQLGASAEWEGAEPISRGTLFSDRNIYRPGETVRMKGITRFLRYGKLLSGKGMEYLLTLTDPTGKESPLGKATASDFGTFAFDVTTRAGMPLGWYTVGAAAAQGGKPRFAGSFRLEEFRAPQFAVAMEKPQPVAVAGGSVPLAWSGSYYFGAPMADAPASLHVTRERASYAPKGWEEFSFGIPSWLDDREVSLSGVVLEEKSTLDATGKGGKTLVLEGKIPFPLTYRADVEVEDVGKQTGSGSSSFIVLPDGRLAGLKLSDWIVTAGKGITASVILTDPEGKPITGIPLRVALLKREWHAIGRENADGTVVTERTLVKKEIASAELVSGAAPLEATLTPTEAGSYLVVADLASGALGGGAALPVWVAGKEYAAWVDAGEDRLAIVLDKKEYQVGDTVTAFVPTPFRQTEALLAVLRDKIFAQELRQVAGSGFTFSFPVTEEMIPNVFVSAVLLNRGEPLIAVEEQERSHMEKIGYALAKVSAAPRRLAVTAVADRAKVKPGETVTVDLSVVDAAGKGKWSELTVMVVDEAILALTGYRPPDLVDIVFAPRGLSARVNDNRSFLITRTELLTKAAGWGGGMEFGEGRVRREFLRLAHYDPALITDAQGKARFTFKAPDNLTTWRVMAVAVGQDDRFGYGDTTVIATQPFIARDILPRFVRVGDTFSGGAAVTNLTSAAGAVSVSASLVGDNSVLAFPLGAATTATVGEVAPGKAGKALFPFKAVSPGTALLRFAATFSGTADGAPVKGADTIEVPLTVLPLTATETVVAVGETEGTAAETIKVPDDARRDVGGLTVTLASTGLVGIGEGAKYLVDYPYGCLEQTVSRLLALIELSHLSDKYRFALPAVKPVEQVIEGNLKKIYSMQNPDGGFRFWPSADESTCWVSPYVARLFGRCREMGREIPVSVTVPLIGYLEAVLRQPCFPTTCSWRCLAEYRLRVLEGLAALGVRDNSYLGEYFNRRRELSYGGQIALARLMAGDSRWKAEIATLMKEIGNGLFLTARTAHVEDRRELPDSWQFLYSPVIGTAEALRLWLTVSPKDPLSARLARYLLDARRNGRWRHTYENAAALDALVAYSLVREAEAPEFLAAVTIAGAPMIEQLFRGHDSSVVSFALPSAALPTGPTPVTAGKDGRGTLYWTMAYAHRLEGPQPARSEGFSVTRTLRDPKTGVVLATYGADAPAPLTLKAGEVVEVLLEFLVPQSSSHLVVDDPIPAGVEPVDTSLKTTSQRYRSSEGEGGSEDEEGETRGGAYLGYWYNPFTHRELHDDRVVLVAPSIMPGVYRYRYLVRVITPGSYLWPGTNVALMYEPEQFARGAEGPCAVE
jgi:hypothetical protein